MSNFHFYLLDERDEILTIVDVDLPHDDAAIAYARTLLTRCRVVEFMRGSVLLGHVVGETDGSSAR